MKFYDKYLNIGRQPIYVDMNCQQICKISRKKNLTEVKIFQKVFWGTTFLNTLYICSIDYYAFTRGSAKLQLFLLKHSIMQHKSLSIQQIMMAELPIISLLYIQGVSIKIDRQQCFAIISITTGIYTPNIFIAIQSSLLHNVQCHSYVNFFLA